jgi:transposase
MSLGEDSSDADCLIHGEPTGLEVGDVDEDGGCRLVGGAGGVPRLVAAPGRQGPKRPAVPRSAALFLGSQHHVADAAERFGKWNSVWKRFDRLSKAGVFETFFDHLASLSSSAHLVQMFDSTIVRAHVSAAGAKGGRKVRRSVVPAAASPPKST